MKDKRIIQFNKLEITKKRKKGRHLAILISLVCI